MYVLWLERVLGWGEEVSEKGSVKQTKKYGTITNHLFYPLQSLFSLLLTSINAHKQYNTLHFYGVDHCTHAHNSCYIFGVQHCTLIPSHTIQVDIQKTY